MSNKHNMSLTLGPVLFNWEPEKWRDFYYRVADEAPIDHVILGEIVCSKRAPFFTPHIPDVLKRLESAGKKVILGAPILIMQPKERQAAAELSGAGYIVEANDITSLQTISDTPFSVGPFINIYNEAARSFFEKKGAVRISLNGELSLTSIKEIATGATVPIEVFAFGRMPLAISARCYHARSYGLAKDGCQYVCGHHPDGMDVDTMDGQPFLTVNGVQTMSHTFHSIITDLDALAASGVSSLRLSPHDLDMVAVSKLYRNTCDGTIDPRSAADQISNLIEGQPMSNGFLHGKEGFRARGALGDFVTLM